MALLAYSARSSWQGQPDVRAYTFAYLRLSRICWGDGPTGGFCQHNGIGTTPRIQPGRDNSVGDSSPSLRVRGPWSFRFRLPVNAVAYNLGVSALQPTAAYARPKLVLLPNPGIGVTGTSQSAGAGASWVAIGPINFTPSSKGVIEVLLVNPEKDTDCHFDNLSLVPA